MSKLTIRAVLIGSLALAASACGGGGGGEIQRGDGGVDAPGGGACNPISQTNCADGEKCAQVELNPAMDIRVTDCVPDGDKQLGADCMQLATEGPMAYDDCVAGNECVFDTCREVCSTQGGAGAAAAQGTCGDAPNGKSGVCAPFQNFHDTVPDVGLCLDRCGPLTQGEDCTNAGFACNSGLVIAPSGPGGSNEVNGWYGSCARPIRNAGMCGTATPCGTDSGNNGGPCECGCEATMSACNLNWCDPGYDRFGVDGYGDANTEGATLATYRMINPDPMANGTPFLTSQAATTCVQYCAPDDDFLKNGVTTAGGQQGLTGNQCTKAGTECRYLASMDTLLTLAANYEALEYPPPGEAEVGICVVAARWGSCADNMGAEKFWQTFIFADPTVPEPVVIDPTAINDFVPGCNSFAEMKAAYEATLPEIPSAVAATGKNLKFSERVLVPPGVLERAKRTGGLAE